MYGLDLLQSPSAVYNITQQKVNTLKLKNNCPKYMTACLSVSLQRTNLSYILYEITGGEVEGEDLFWVSWFCKRYFTKTLQ